MTGSFLFTWKNKTRNKRKRKRNWEHKTSTSSAVSQKETVRSGKREKQTSTSVNGDFFLQALTCSSILSQLHAELSVQYTVVIVNYSLYFVIKRLICCDDFQCVLECLQLCWNGFITSLCLCQWNTLFVSIHAIMCVTQMALGLRKLCPAKCASSPNSSSILRAKRRASRAEQTERTEVISYWSAFDTVWISIHVGNMNTHLMSWLYLARRSDRQGAPVLIWREAKLHRKKYS